MIAYHYTTLNNLKDILNSDVFILSKFENANDFKEKTKFVEQQNKYRYMSLVLYGENKIERTTYSWRNPVMWRFYAQKDKHNKIASCKGVCIGVNVEKIKARTITQMKVSYIRGVSEIDKQIENDDITQYLMEKSGFWSFEQEYRLLFDNSIEKLENFSEAIDSIHFDYNMENGEIDAFIEQYLKGRNIKCYRTYIDSVDGRIQQQLIMI